MRCFRSSRRISQAIKRRRTSATSVPDGQAGRAFRPRAAAGYAFWPKRSGEADGETAVMSNYAEITPAHLLIALARVAAPDPEDRLSVSDPTLREAFDHFGIDPERFRR